MCVKEEKRGKRGRGRKREGREEEKGEGGREREEGEGEEGGEGGREGVKGEEKVGGGGGKRERGQKRDRISISHVHVYQCSPPTFFDIRRHVEVSEGEGYVPTDLCGEVGVKSKPLQMNAENLTAEEIGSGHIHNPHNWFWNETRMSHYVPTSGSLMMLISFKLF